MDNNSFDLTYLTWLYPGSGRLQKGRNILDAHPQGFYSLMDQIPHRLDVQSHDSCNVLIIHIQVELHEQGLLLPGG